MEKRNVLSADSKRFDSRKYFMFFALGAIWLIFSVLSGGIFISARNLSNLIRQMAFTAILSMGMMCVILLGEIDLSAGSVVGLCGGVFAILNKQCGWNFVPALLITLLLGLVLGIWNGWWVAYRAVPAFIVTLSGQLIFRGALVGLTGGKTISPLDERLQWIALYIDKRWVWLIAAIVLAVLLFVQWKDRSKKDSYGLDAGKKSTELIKSLIYVALVVGFVLIMNAYKGVPRAVYLIGILFVIFFVLTKETPFGRRLFAIGGNKAASKLVGIDVKKTTLIIFGIEGLIAAICAIFLCARLNSAAVNAGTNAELDAIASCVIGGCSMAGGVASLPGVIIGALVMASIDNGMALLNTPAFWQTIIKGAVLLIAVWADMSKKKQ